MQPPVPPAITFVVSVALPRLQSRPSNLSNFCFSLSLSLSSSLTLPYSRHPFVSRWATSLPSFVRYLLSSLSLSQFSTPPRFRSSFRSKRRCTFSAAEARQYPRDSAEFSVKSPHRGRNFRRRVRARWNRKKKREREREGKERPTRSRNKQASRQCAVGGTRPWKHVVSFFPRLFSPLFHARFSSHSFFLSFLHSPPRLSFLALVSELSSFPPPLFRLLLFLACSECAFGKFRDQCASSALKFSGHPPGCTRKEIYVASRSMISAQERSGRVPIALKSRIET